MKLIRRRADFQIDDPSLMRVLDAAREEALVRRSRVVDPRHLLLGLLSTDDPLLPRLLARAGVDLAGLGSGVRAALPPPVGAPGPREAGRALAYTPEATRILELAAEESDELEHPRIGPEHLLIALLRHRGDAAALVRQAGLTLEAARSHLFGVRQERASSGDEEPSDA
ncbi:MAG TPA: Clp protease N-terminal domain-containing protein [Longimicrobium sp.]